MKKLRLLSLLLIIAITADAQTLTSLSEDFNVPCSYIGPNYPPQWTEWNIVPPVSPLEWNCAPLSGKDGTPGIQCNGLYSGVNYADTAWLFTPKLDLSSYSNSIFLKFDAKYEFSAGRLHVKVSTNYHTRSNPDSLSTTWDDITSALTPMIGPGDSSGWVTHWADLTPYKSTPIYVAFNYTSSTTAAGDWTIDNVETTPYSVKVNDPIKDMLHLSILGNSTNEQITLLYSLRDPGNYGITIYDNVGREVHKESFYAGNGTSTHAISGLALHPGIYIIKMNNNETYGTIKTIVE